MKVLSLINQTFSISVSLRHVASFPKAMHDTPFSFSVGTSPALHPMDTQLGCLSRPRSCPSALFLQRGADTLELVYFPH